MMQRNTQDTASYQKTLLMLTKPVRFILFLSIAVFIIISSCTKNDVITDPVSNILNLPASAFNYANIVLPAYLTTPPVLNENNTPGNNAITDNRATLGRVLFYDKNLSVNNSIACASCHKQAFGFSDSAVLSKGFAGGLTARNSMSLTNARYYPDGKFFWDERAATLEIQTLQPIQNHVEMGMVLDSLVKKLSALSYYPSLFQKAFGDAAVTSDRVSKALSQFVRSIISYQSKYDDGRSALAANQNPAAIDFSNFTAQENRGKQLFFSPQLACAACHGTETFTALEPKNNGLDILSTDAGVGGITNIASQNGLFKVSSLKNIELTAPYMHDGRFATLEQVVEHYNSGIQPNANLAPELKDPNGNPKQMNLSVADKAALVAFLKTLTDQKLITDEKYSNPFVVK